MPWGGPSPPPPPSRPPPLAPASLPPDAAAPTPTTLRAAETAKQFIEGLYAAQRRSVADRAGR